MRRPKIRWTPKVLPSLGRMHAVNVESDLNGGMGEVPPNPRIDRWRAALATALLCASCSVMTCAWYVHLKYAESWSLVKAILISWLVAGGEYILQVPGNRIGMRAGLSAAQLRAIAELAILFSFLYFQLKVLEQHANQAQQALWWGGTHLTTRTPEDLASRSPRISATTCHCGLQHCVPYWGPQGPSIEYLERASRRRKRKSTRVQHTVSRRTPDTGLGDTCKDPEGSRLPP